MARVASGDHLVGVGCVRPGGRGPDAAPHVLVAQADGHAREPLVIALTWVRVSMQ
jgi:hypothetical protein